MKVKTKLDYNKISSNLIMGGKLLNLNRVLQVHFSHNNSDNAKSASSDLIGPRRKISIFSRGNSLARVKVIQPPAFDTEHETTTTDDDVKRRMAMQPGLIDCLWATLKEKYHNIPNGTFNALKKTQLRMSKEGRQKAKRKKQSNKYYNQTIPVYAMQKKRKNKIKNVERVLGVVEPVAVPSRTRKKPKTEEKKKGTAKTEKKKKIKSTTEEKKKSKSTTEESKKSKSTSEKKESLGEEEEEEAPINPNNLEERTGAAEPDLDWVNRHYVRIVGTFPRNEREFALARLQKQSRRFVLARVGYRGPNAGLRGTKATVITWGGVPASTTCSCPYDFCTCKGNPIGSNSQYPCGVLKCDLWGGFVKFFSWLGLGAFVARIRKKPATFGPSLIRAVGAAKRNYLKAGEKGDELLPDTCLTGCHAFYRRDFDDGLKKKKRKKMKVIGSDLEEKKEKKKKKKKEEKVIEVADDKEEEEADAAECKKEPPPPPPPPPPPIIIPPPPPPPVEPVITDKCTCCKFCVGTEDEGEIPCYPQQPCYGAGYGPHPLDPALNYGMPPCDQGAYGYALPPPGYGTYGSAQLLYDQQQPQVKKRVTYEDDLTTEDSENKYAPRCQGKCALHAKPRPISKPYRPKDWCGPECNCGSILCALRKVVSTHLVTPCTCPSERNAARPAVESPTESPSDEEAVRRGMHYSSRAEDGTQNSTENKNIYTQPQGSRSTGTTGPLKTQIHGTDTDKYIRKNARL